MVRERGVALLTVLFILALLTTVAAYLVADEALWLRRVENLRDTEQAWQLMRGSEAWARAVLRRDLAAGGTDHLGEAWARLSQPVRVEGGALQTRVEDAQGRFNLNNLRAGRDKVWYPAYQRLLALLELDPKLADTLVDWLDDDGLPTGAAGMEDGGYLARRPPYRSANRMLADTAELAWVDGYDAAARAALAPYITALPAVGVRLNVNTCPPLLLRILARAPLPEGAGEALAAGRGETGYASVEAFLQHEVLAGQGAVVAPLVTVASSYFLIASTARFGRATGTLRSLAHRSGEGGVPQVVILARRRTLL